MKVANWLPKLGYCFALFLLVGSMESAFAQTGSLQIRFGDVDGGTKTNQNVTASIPSGASTVRINVQWNLDFNTYPILTQRETDIWKNGQKLTDDCDHFLWSDLYCVGQSAYPVRYTYFDLGAGTHSFRVQSKLYNNQGVQTDVIDRTHTVTVTSNNLTASISGPSAACSGDFKTWSSNVSGGSGSYSYRWDTSNNGSSYSYAGSGSSYSTSMPPGLDLYLKLTVTSGSQQKTDYHFVENIDGSPNCNGPVAAFEKDVLELADETPASFSLAQNHPNPFNPSTNITFSLPEASDVKLSVFDITGREVAELVNGYIAAGNHVVAFNAEDLPSGLYLYRIQAGSYVQTKRMSLIK